MTTTDVSPQHLAEQIVARPRPLLVGLDVDGVLAPIVERADQAALLPGVDDALARLLAIAPAAQLAIAVVSGRAVDDLGARYAFDAGIAVVGSHGLEVRDGAPLALDADEAHTLDQLTTLADAAARDAGSGAWVERKPASSVLHVREADPATAATVVEQLTSLASLVPGAHVKRGHAVVELMARSTSKATAMAELRRATGAATVVFVGDDHTDEEVFATLDDSDVAVRVGGGDTVAHHRLADPPAVLAWLSSLADALER